MSEFPSKTKFKDYTAKRRLQRTPSIESIINLSSDADDFLRRLNQLTSRDLKKIEKYTVGQYKNKLWMLHRKHTITASIAHRINNAYKKDDYRFRVRALIAKLMHVPKYIPALIYGQNSEEKAIHSYLQKFREDHVNLRCMEMGLQLYDKMPYIGASVDGLLVCDCCDEKILVEVKCPFSLENESILENGSRLPYLTDDLKLKTTHPHWTQVQTGLGVYGLTKAKFIVWSETDFLALDIEFDSTYFNELVNNLERYYKTNYLPHIYWG